MLAGGHEQVIKTQGAPRIPLHMNNCMCAHTHTKSPCLLTRSKSTRKPEDNTHVDNKEIPLKTDRKSQPLSFPRLSSPMGAAEPNCISSNNKHTIRPNDVIAAVASTC